MTSSLLDVRRGAQTPRVSTYPAADYSSGPDAADLAAAAGLVLDPWQRYVLEHSLGEQPDGRWAAREVAVWVPRQNGKGALIEARVMAGLFLFGEKRILWSAHEYKTAQEGFLRIKELIQGAPELHALVKRYWEGSGEQGIELTTGQRLKFIARSRGSGRGFSGDLIILDEAQELTLPQMKALFSTMSAKSVQGNPQIWYLGTPPEDPAAWVYGLRRDGEAGKDRLAYFDWGLGEIDPSEPIRDRLQRYADRDLWYAANPGLGIRISEEFVEDELARLREGFASERLGLWLPYAGDDEGGVIPAEQWAAMADPTSTAGDDIAIAVDVTPDRAWSSIGIASPRPEGGMHLELIDHRRGTAWVVDRLVELRERHDPVAICLDAKGPAGSLVTDLEKAGITLPADPERPERGDLILPTYSEVAAACGQLLDAARDGTDRHIDQAQLTTAVLGAKTRPLGDAVAWGRRQADVDISPLVAVTLARWALLERAHLISELECGFFFD